MMIMKRKKYSKSPCQREGITRILNPWRKFNMTAAIAAPKTLPMPPKIVAETGNKMITKVRKGYTAILVPRRYIPATENIAAMTMLTAYACLLLIP
jgi:hypothetical protein